VKAVQRREVAARGQTILCAVSTLRRNLSRRVFQADLKVGLYEERLEGRPLTKSAEGRPGGRPLRRQRVGESASTKTEASTN